jgi:hypothetical protein
MPSTKLAMGQRDIGSIPRVLWILRPWMTVVERPVLGLAHRTSHSLIRRHFLHLEHWIDFVR